MICHDCFRNQSKSRKKVLRMNWLMNPSTLRKLIIELRNNRDSERYNSNVLYWDYSNTIKQI